jgi:RNA polymerase sigma-70 factor, ECF subfamily
VSGLASTAATDTPELRAAVAAGDREALATMWRLHRGRLEAWLRRRHGCDPDLAADLVSETFARALARAGQWQEMGIQYGCWLQQVALRLLLDHRKCAATRYASWYGPVDPEDPEDGWRGVEMAPDPAEVAIARADRSPLRKAVAAALADLNPRQREVVTLRYWQDLMPAEIADRLGSDTTVVKSVQYRAVRALARDPRVRELWQTWTS